MTTEFLKVSLGDVYRPKSSPDDHFIVVDLDNANSWVHSAKICSLEDGREYIHPFGGGTAFHENIAEVIGHWNLKKVEVALILGCQITIGQQKPFLVAPATRVVIENLEAAAQKDPVILRPG